MNRQEHGWANGEESRKGQNRQEHSGAQGKAPVAPAVRNVPQVKNSAELAPWWGWLHDSVKGGLEAERGLPNNPSDFFFGTIPPPP